MSKKSLAIAAILLIAVIALIVSPAAAQIPADAIGGCVMPPDEYFLVDGPMNNGLPEHEGIQSGPGEVLITLDERIQYFSGSDHHLMEIGELYPLGKSHNEQDYLRLLKMHYCHVEMQYPYIQQGPESSTPPSGSQHLNAG